MKEDNLRLFLDSLRDDPALAQKFEGLSTPTEIVAAATALGIGLEESDFVANGSEVALDELASICGGIFAYPQADD